VCCHEHRLVNISYLNNRSVDSSRLTGNKYYCKKWFCLYFTTYHHSLIYNLQIYFPNITKLRPLEFNRLLWNKNVDILEIWIVLALPHKCTCIYWGLEVNHNWHTKLHVSADDWKLITTGTKSYLHRLEIGSELEVAHKVGCFYWGLGAN